MAFMTTPSLTSPINTLRQVCLVTLPQLYYDRCLLAETGPGERSVVGDGAVRRGGGGDDAEERGPRHQAHLGREDCGGVRPNAKGNNNPMFKAAVDLSITCTPDGL